MAMRRSKRLEGGLRTLGSPKAFVPGLPIITIVTVVFNSQEYLEPTIHSVAAQGYKNINYIVIDGGSTDGTLRIIKRNEHLIDYWLSESDLGIYHAMNKGVAHAAGSWIYFLNSRDVLLADSVIANVAPLLRGDHEIIHFNCEVRNGAGQEVFVRRYPEFPHDLTRWPCVQHQSVFCQTSTVRELGGFDLRYRIAADYDFFARCFVAGKKIASLRHLKVAIYNADGISASHRTAFKLMREIRDIQRRNFNGVYWPLQIQIGFKHFLQKLPAAGRLEQILRRTFLARR